MNYTDFILTIIVMLLGIIAFRVNINFDYNDWSKARDKKKVASARNICPHASMRIEPDRYGIESCFETTVGTLQYQCSRCKIIVNNIDEQHTKYWADNPNKFIEAEKLFNKKLKNLGML